MKKTAQADVVSLKELHTGDAIGSLHKNSSSTRGQATGCVHHFPDSGIPESGLIQFANKY